MKEIKKDFVHLHVHSDYSVLDGIAKISDYVKRAKELNTKALAITEHGNLSSTFQFITECNDAKIKPILGCEFYLRDDLIRDKKRNHIVALARNKKGWKQLLKLNHASFQDEAFYYNPSFVQT